MEYQNSKDPNITNKQIGMIHGLLEKLNWLENKHWHLQQITGKKMGFTYLTVSDGAKIIDVLKYNLKVKGKKTRGKIIHYLCLAGMVDSKGSADWKRINNFVQNIGSNNPKKRRLHELGLNELNAVCTQVEQLYSNILKR